MSLRRDGLPSAQFLLHDIQSRLLLVTCSGARKQGANRPNRLSVTSDNPADVGLPQLQPENDNAAVGNLREHNFVREFDELADDKLEELSHAFELSDRWRVVQSERPVSVLRRPLSRSGRPRFRPLCSAKVCVNWGSTPQLFSLIRLQLQPARPRRAP